MRTLLWLSLLLAGGVLILSAAETDLAASFPALATPASALVALGVILINAARPAARPWTLRYFATAASALAAGAWLFGSYWAESRRPAEPLTATVSTIADDGTVPSTVAALDSLKLTERRLLARVSGRRRNFELAVEGYLMVPSDGDYRFELECDDWCALTLDGETFGGEGRWSERLELTAGARRFDLRYRQRSGPARLVVRWDTPAAVEPWPLESHLAGSAEALERVGSRFSTATRWAVFLAALVWLLGASLVLFRAAESSGSWIRAFRAWLREPPDPGPTPLVRPRSWLVAGGALLAAGAVARLSLPGRLEAYAREYAVSPRRAPFVLERVESFPDYLFFLAGLCLLVAIVFRALGDGYGSGYVERRADRSVTRWLLVGIAATLLWGGAVSQWEWDRYGRPCYDGYCDYAERVRDWMTAPGSESWGRLRGHLAGNYHANSPVGPILIAGVSAVGGAAIVPAYRLVSALATLGTLLLLLVIARRELEMGIVPALVAAFLFTASGSVQRSFLFPQTDALAMFFFTLAVERAFRLRRAWTAGRYAAASVALGLALLTKLSALPVAAIVFVVLAWPPEGGFRSIGDALRAAARAALVVVPPAALTAGLVLALRTTENVRTELVRIETLDSRFSFHLVATLVTLLPWLLALALSLRRRWRPIELTLLGAVVLYLVALWGSGASGWERFYLNAMPMALPLAVSRFSRLPELRRARVAGILLAAYVIGHTVRMLFHLYNGV